MAYQAVAAGSKPVHSPIAHLAPSVSSFALGVFCADRLTPLLPPSLLWLALGIATLAIVVCFATRKQLQAFVLLIPFFFILGLIRATPFTEPPLSADHIYNRIATRSEVTVAGILTEMPALPGNRCRFKIAAEQLIFPDQTISPTHGSVLLTMEGRLPDNIEPGDRLVARGVLKRPHSFQTPGVFDYQKYLEREDIWITGWVRSPALLHKLNRPPAESSVIDQLRSLPERLRHRVGNFLQQNLDQPASSLYRALLLGDRSAVPAGIIEDFTAAGCIHLLAISGTHMGIIAFLVTALTAWLLKRSTRLLLYLPVWKTAALIALPVLFAYAMLAGFQTPAVRALTMITVFLLAILLDRQWSIPVNIAIAAFLLLAWKPPLIHTASFQLSFTAVLAITLLYPQVRTLFSASSDHGGSVADKLANWLRAGLTVSTAATVGVFPLLLLHFNRFSLLSPLSTLLIEPFLCLWALTIGLAACLLLPFSPLPANALFHLGSLGLDAALSLSSTLARLPFASLRLPALTPLQFLLYYLSLVAFSQRHRLQHSKSVATLAFLVLTGSFFWNSALTAGDNNLRVNILDVGQGSATVVELPGHRAILIDGGSYLGGQFDVGERIIAPFLWHRGINRLQAVIISHPHADHYNGIPFILRNFAPHTLWTNGHPSSAPEYLALLNEAQDLAIAVKTPKPGALLYADANSKLLRVNSTPEAQLNSLTTDSPGTTTNRQSLVLRLDYKQRSFLFPGDIDTEVEREIVEEGSNIEADVLLAPHHGSQGSLGNALLQAVTPAYIVVSAGKSRPGGMATDEAVRKWRSAGATVFDTADNGAVTFTTDGIHLSVTTAGKP